MFLAIDHPAIASYDVEGLAEWYCHNLGMQVIATNGQTPPAMVIGYGDSIAGSAAVIELMPANDPGPRPETFTRFQPGIRHIALRVSDFDEAYEQLKFRGVRFHTEPGQALGGGKTALFRDPEGNELQIVQR
jgi:catechol 2,3-dioxygenase-like lactoylglutathione lyase family enzyme